MSKLVLLTDTHLGGKNDVHYFNDYIEKFYKEIFFPYIDKHKIIDVVHLGDLFDRRKFINFVSLQRAHEFFFEEIDKRDIKLHIIVGNHDVYYRNSNFVNSPELLLKSYDYKIYSGPETITVDHVNIDLVPWINSENEKETKKFIKNSKSDILLGHLEIDGFSMYKGITSIEGMKQKVFKNYDLVCSGHYHHKSQIGNIHYLGSPYQITWHDHDDPRGFHILDTATRDLEFIPNPFTLFEKIFYDDVRGNMKKFNFDDVKGKIVKLIVIQKEDQKFYDKFLEDIEKVGVIDLKIEEDYSDFLTSTGGEIVDVKDTFEILTSYVDNIDCKDEQKEVLKQKLTEVYMEAIHTQ